MAHGTAESKNFKRSFQLESLEQRQLLAADLIISEFMAVNSGGLEDGAGNSKDWIELHNRGDAVADLDGWYLSDDPTELNKYSLPKQTLAAGAFLIVFASGPSDRNGRPLQNFIDEAGNPHANFKLSGDGEFLALVEPDGATVASHFGEAFPPQTAGISYGVGADSNETGYFHAPTPGAPNSELASGVVADTKFSVDRGFYDAPFNLQIKANTPGASIVFTTDGSVPTPDNGTVVDAESDESTPVATVRIETTTTLRAVALKDGYISSNVDTQTYIFLQDVVRQSASQEGMPSRWDGRTQAPIRADYGMDPDIVDDPDYTADLLKGLREIPTMSIVLDPDDMFSEESGIYVNSGLRGREWEHPTSVEIIEPDGSTFQTDSGIRIHGFSWRFHSNTPKHSFRLEFRSEYGPSKLEYPLFPDAPVDRFDSIVLRAQGGRAWAGHQNPHEAQYQRDTFARDLSREMGRVDGHATYVHLYINGLYWGLYNPVERPDAQMGEEYFGGTEKDYDALNRRTVTNEVIDGDLRRYTRMTLLANRANRAGETTDEQYAELQQYLAIDEFIDYMILNQYVTNRDGITAFGGNNQRAIGSRVGDAQFRFFVWDMEYSMWNATDNNNVDTNRPALAGTNDPPNGSWAIYKALRQHPEFRLRYADRVQKHFFNDGALTPENARATWMERANQIENAIVAESARWGDAKRSRPYTRDVEWRREQNRLLTRYFPRRSEVLVDDLLEVGLYTTTTTPSFLLNGTSKHGGVVSRGDAVSLIQEEVSGSQRRDLVSDDSIVSAFVPASGELGDQWQQPQFVEGSVGETWQSGTNGVGFDNGDSYLSKLNIDTSVAARNNASVFVRIPFSVENVTALDAINGLKLHLLVDDGFVAYLNGVEVASLNVPESPTWDSTATASAEADLESPLEFDISEHIDLLVASDNVLAIHGMNSSKSSRDMIIHAVLTAEVAATDEIWYTTNGSDPRLPGGQINNSENGGTAQRFNANLTIDATTQIRARAISFAGEWSAINETIFTIAEDKIPGDFNGNSIVDATDIDLLCQHIGHDNLVFDLNNDQSVSAADHEIMIAEVMKATPGDANLDGKFDSADLILIFQRSEYEDPVDNNSGWEDGDWNCDQEFTTRDLVAAFRTGRYEAVAAASRTTQGVKKASPSVAANHRQAAYIP